MNTTPAAAANLRTRTSGVVHSAVNGLPACPARSRTTSLAGAYAETRQPVTCKNCLKLVDAAPAEPVEASAAPRGEGREYGVCGTVDGAQALIYTGPTLEQATANMLNALPTVRQREAFAVTAVVVSRTPGGEWTPLGADQPAAGGSGAVKLRPYWQTAPCPAWCELTHDDRDQPADRFHLGADRVTPLTREAPVQVAPGRWAPEELGLCLRQGDHDDEPVAELRRGDAPAVRLTLAEAEQLQMRLSAVLAEARTAPAGSSAPGCAPWCVRHDDCTRGGRHLPDPEGGMCWAPPVPLPGGRYGSAGTVELSNDAEDGALIQVANDSDAVLTVDEAEEFAHAILAQVALARTTIPVTPEPLELAAGEDSCSDSACRICRPA
ncbi:DUF6907 domain-containing protein [Streptosporangium sandarakinum]|uniref:DUF6907 domain-containing protein n=1 Tax=Streptosporangium sandarakinum TaxID=1260955 RepID=UPI00369C65EE